MLIQTEGIDTSSFLTDLLSLGMVPPGSCVACVRMLLKEFHMGHLKITSRGSASDPSSCSSTERAVGDAPSPGALPLCKKEGWSFWLLASTRSGHICCGTLESEPANGELSLPFSVLLCL